MKYEKATAELVHFDNSDVITTSGGDCRNYGWTQGCHAHGGCGKHGGNSVDPQLYKRFR